MKQYRIKEKTRARLSLLRKGKEAMQEEVVNMEYNLIYHRWTDELKEELAAAETKDQQLADIVVYVSMYYRSVNNAAP